VPLEYYAYVFAIFAFVLGSVVGSFLNVCIYRMPLDLSVNEPKRSFCPICKYQIPWYHNIPLLSWLQLGGKCRNCKTKIPFRYFAVELLTAITYLVAWLVFPVPVVFAYWILLSLFIVATFIDIDHFIIPDSITWGGTVAGIVLSTALPVMMGVESHWQGLMWSVIGAAAGYFTLWGVVEGGKLAFGRKKLRLEKTMPFVWKRDGENADLRIGEESFPWSEIFSRESDRLIIECREIRVDGATMPVEAAIFHYNRLVLPDGDRDLMKIDQIQGKTASLIIPREAMGFGDVKFIAAIGAFLGWQAVFFTIFAASIVGALVGGATILMRKREWSAKIPFGPYLALGAVVWMFTGRRLLDWYLAFLIPQ